MTTRVLLTLLLLGSVAWAQDQAPTGTNASDSNTTCDATVHTTIDDDPDSPGGDWCIADNNNISWSMTVTFADPGTLDTTTDAQVIEYYVRSFDEGQTGDPDIQMFIYDLTTVACDTLHESGTLTSLTDAGFPNKITDSWTAAGLSGSADVCVQIDCTKAAGGGAARNSCDIDALEWEAAVSAGGTTMIISMRPKQVVCVNGDCPTVVSD